MQHAVLDNLPTIYVSSPQSFSALLKIPVFYSSYHFHTFPLLLLFNCFSMHNQSEKHTVFLFRQRLVLLFLLARGTINIPFKKSSIAQLRTSCSKTAAEQPDTTDALAVCPTPLNTEFDRKKNRRKQQHKMLGGTDTWVLGTGAV